MSAPAGRTKTTLTDVASSAGVSVPTASKVLNGHAGVSAEARRRVRAAADRLGYVPRAVTRPSVRRSVEVMVDRLNSLYAMEVLRGVTLAAEAAGVEVAVSRLHPAHGQDSGEWAHRLTAAGRCGAIVLTGHLTDAEQGALAQEHLPVVAVDPIEPGTTTSPSVGSTNFAGGFAATEHLIGLGHRRIGALGGRQASVAARARMHGFRAACATEHVPVEESLVVFTDFGYDTGLAVADEWLVREDRPTAVIAASDAQAMGVLESARRHGLAVPGDLSVVGYDDTYIAGWATPPLTVVRQPLEEMGKVALRTLLGIVEGVPLASRHVELATELVVRQSTGPPPAHAAAPHEEER